MKYELTDQISRRLSLIKRLHQLASEQSEVDAAASGLCILALHDAVEIFLSLLAEVTNMEARKLDFMAYWPELRKKGLDLSFDVSMKKLNAARVNLKHLGILPSREDVREFSNTTKIFLVENVEKCFGINFTRLSLVGLIKDVGLRDRIELAESHMNDERFTDSLECLTLAFFSAVGSGASLRPLSPFELNLIREARPGVDNLFSFQKSQGDFEKRLENMEQLSFRIVEAITLQGLSVDLKKYAKFKESLPYYIDIARNTFWKKENYVPLKEKNRVAENIEFVVDLALRKYIAE